MEDTQAASPREIYTNGDIRLDIINKPDGEQDYWVMAGLAMMQISAQGVRDMHELLGELINEWDNNDRG